MATKIIVSYDGSDSDHDALALGKLLGATGAQLELAYVRHHKESEAQRETLAQHEAEALLDTGAAWLGQPDVTRKVVLSASTPEGLWELAQGEHASVVVFGSEYRTAPGHVSPGTSAQRLLDGGPVAVAIAPAGLHERTDTAISKIAVVTENGDPSPHDTAASLAGALGAAVTARPNDTADLMVIGSRPNGAAGRIMISAAAQYIIELSRCPVLVIPRGVAVSFGPTTPAES